MSFVQTYCFRIFSVALREEGVDRNACGLFPVLSRFVALREEGVDRNIDSYLVAILDILSPSARRAWIEIFIHSWLKVGVVRRPPRGGRG